MESQTMSRLGSIPCLRRMYLKRKSPSEPRLEVAMRLPRRSSGFLISGRTSILVWTPGTVCATLIRSAPLRSASITVGSATGEAKMLPPSIAAEVPRAAQKYQLDVETVLFVNPGFLGDPGNPVAAGERGHAPVDLFERLAENWRRNNADEESQRGNPEGSRDCLHGDPSSRLLPHPAVSISDRRAF